MFPSFVAALQVRCVHDPHEIVQILTLLLVQPEGLRPILDGRPRYRTRPPALFAAGIQIEPGSVVQLETQPQFWCLLNPIRQRESLPQALLYDLALDRSLLYGVEQDLYEFPPAASLTSSRKRAMLWACCIRSRYRSGKYLNAATTFSAVTGRSSAPA